MNWKDTYSYLMILAVIGYYFEYAILGFTSSIFGDALMTSGISIWWLKNKANDFIEYVTYKYKVYDIMFDLVVEDLFGVK
jgi:hypothetical protein